jgi:hypothetical protein
MMERSCRQRRTRIHPWTSSLVRRRLDEKGTRQVDGAVPGGGGGVAQLLLDADAAAA